MVSRSPVCELSLICHTAFAVYWCAAMRMPQHQIFTLCALKIIFDEAGRPQPDGYLETGSMLCRSQVECTEYAHDNES